MASFSLDWRQERLPGGLRLVTIARPASSTVALAAYIRAGSQYDAQEQVSNPAQPALGLAHLTEHMVFKGTKTRSQREIFATIESIGGLLEAGTSKEYANLRAVVLPQHVSIGLEILADVLCEPALREEHFSAEKRVVRTEIRRAQDQESVVFDRFAQLLWPGSPLRYPVMGTADSLDSLEHEQLLAFHGQRYVSGNTVIVVCGDINHDDVLSQVERAMQAFSPGAAQLPDPAPALMSRTEQRSHLERHIGHSVLLLGVPTVGMKHEDRSALKIMERILGMGGSARLYQSLREKRQLAYSVRTVNAQYEDSGYFAVYAVCDPDRVRAVRDAILEEWAKIRECDVSPSELQAAKSNYAGTLARRFETNLAIAGICGVETLLSSFEPFDAAIGRIDGVTREDVIRVANTYLNPEFAVTVSVGKQPAG